LVIFELKTLVGRGACGFRAGNTPEGTRLILLVEIG
jgi:hypothetical protein